MALTVVTNYANAADQALPHAGAGYSAYTYAQTIWLLPQSIVTVSLVTALLPRMSRAAAEGRIPDLRTDLSRALRVSAVVIVPTAFLFQALGLGLVPFSAQYLLLRGFYAFEDTRTPFFLAAWIAAVNIALATACHLLLPVRWAVVGIAGAYALSYLAGLALTARLLRTRLGGRLDEGGLLRTHLKPFCAAVPAAGAGWAAARACAVLGTGTWPTAVALVAGTLTLALVYLLLSRLLKVSELRRLPGMR